MQVHSAVFWHHCFLFLLQCVTLLLTLVLWKTLKIIKEATSTLHIVKGILWGCSPGSRLDRHPDISAIVESQFSGIYAKAGNPFLDISAVAGPQSFPSKHLMFQHQKAICPPPLNRPTYLGLSHIMHRLQQECFWMARWILNDIWK